MNNGNSKDEKIVVKGIQGLEDLIPAFLEHRKKESRQILENLESKDFEAIARAGHSLLGLGGGYGFDEISDSGRLIEQAAMARDAVAVRAAAEKLISFLDRVEVVYD